MCPPYYEKEDLKFQLTKVDEFKRHHDQIAWVIFGTFWAANALLIGALFQTTDPYFIPLKWIVITFFGTVLSIIWYIVEDRAINFLKFYEDTADDLEKELTHYSDAYKKFPTRKPTENENADTSKRFIKGIPVKPIMRAIPVCGAVLWFIALMSPWGFWLCYVFHLF